MTSSTFTGYTEQDQEEEDDDRSSVLSDIPGDSYGSCVPKIGSIDYSQYIRSVLKLLVGDLRLVEWVEHGGQI